MAACCRRAHRSHCSFHARYYCSDALRWRRGSDRMSAALSHARPQGTASVVPAGVEASGVPAAGLLDAMRICASSWATCWIRSGACWGCACVRPVAARAMRSVASTSLRRSSSAYSCCCCRRRTIAISRWRARNRSMLMVAAGAGAGAGLAAAGAGLLAVPRLAIQAGRGADTRASGLNAKLAVGEGWGCCYGVATCSGGYRCGCCCGDTYSGGCGCCSYAATCC